MNKTLGLVGGTSWVSTMDYYRLINEGVNARLGGNQFAKCVIHSFNYADIQALTFRENWAGVLELVGAAADNLVHAGAQGIVLCANTMHLIADDLAKRLDVPIIHIVDATGERVKAAGLSCVALLGTKYTMEMGFFKDRLAARGVSVMIPDASDREFIQSSIFGDLSAGIVRPEVKRRYLDIIASLAARGAEGAILGCTEIPLVVKPEDTSTPTFDTTAIHAEAAVAYALA